MSSDSQNRSADDGRLARQLQARLRDTTPAFEARFDALRRRLAQEDKLPAWKRLLSRLAPVRIAWAMAGSVALVALVIMLQQPRHDQLSTQEREAYAELVTLDETLAVAQPLMDGETLDALLLFTTNNGGRI